MSDPYREATRHERTGMSTLAKVFLVGGGLVATIVVALSIWAIIAWRAAMDEWSEYWEEERIELVREAEAVREMDLAREVEAVREMDLTREMEGLARELEEALRELEVSRELEAFREAEAGREAATSRETEFARAEVAEVSARLADLRAEIARREMEVAEAAANASATTPAANVSASRRSSADDQEPVAEELKRAVVSVLQNAFDDQAFELSPAESGFGIEVTPWEGSVKRLGLDFVSVGELLDRAARGESVLAGVDRSDEARRDREDDGWVPDWVPVFPNSYSSDSFAATVDGLSIGGAVFVADARGHGILDWYSRTALRMSREGTDFKIRQTRNREDRDQDLRNDLGRYAMLWDGRVISVFVIEDHHGDSLFVLLYKETAEAEG